MRRVERDAPAGPDGVAVSADGRRLVIGRERQRFGFGNDAPAGAVSAVVWDVDAGKQRLSVTLPQMTKALVALSPDGKRVAMWGTGTRAGGAWGKGIPDTLADPIKGVQIWDVETAKEVATVSAGKVVVTAVVFSPDGSALAVSGGTGSVQPIDLATKEEKRAFFGCSGQGQRLAFSPDGKTLAAVSDEEVVQRWAVADNRLLDTAEPPVPPAPLAAALRGGRPDVRGFVYPADGRAVVWGVRGDLNLVWEAPAGRALSPTGGHRAPVGGVAAGKELLTAADDGTVIRWATPLVAPAVLPDGKTVAVCLHRSAAAERGTDAVLFDADTGKVKKTLGGTSGTAWGMAFSNDISSLMVGLRDTT